MKSLLRCHACRLTWFPQADAGAACPACGGTQFGGTLELFHAGLVLIAVGLIGWFLRHGPLGDLHPPPAVPVPVQSSRGTEGERPAIDARLRLFHPRQGEAHGGETHFGQSEEGQGQQGQGEHGQTTPEEGVKEEPHVQR